MKRILVIIAVTILSLITIGVASADHTWSGYHWRSDSLSPTVADKTSDSLYDVPAGVAEWAALNIPIKPVMSAKKRGNITVSESSNIFWLGLARIWVEGGHITKGEVKLNTRLLRNYGPEVADHVLCQEVGHVLGLTHITGDSCMNDDLTTLGLFTSPNTHDAEQLALIYDHEDVISGGGGNGKGRGRGGKPQGEWIIVHTTPIP